MATQTLKSELPTLQRVYESICETDLSWYSKFLDSGVSVTNFVNSVEESYLKRICDPITSINHDIWNLCSIASRMFWFRNMALDEEWYKNNQFNWLNYMGLDVELFHVEARSILDYIATIISILAEKPKQSPSNSFRELYQWLEKDSKREDKLGKEASLLVRSASWYSGIREARDDIVHFGANAFVFGSPKDGILFQISKNIHNKIKVEKLLMWNQYVVNFELYGALYFARILDLLEKLGLFIQSKIPRQYILNDVRSNYDGFGVYKNWIKLLIDKIQDNQ